MQAQEASDIGVPHRWMLCFCRTAGRRWMRLIPGRYKHVRAFGYAGHGWYIFYDFQFDGTALGIAHGATARQQMLAWTENADVIAMPARFGVRRMPRLGMTCVAACKHLVGLRSGALFPSQLFRHCMLHGGTLIHAVGADHHDRPDAGAAAAERGGPADAAAAAAGAE